MRFFITSLLFIYITSAGALELTGSSSYWQKTTNFHYNNSRYSYSCPSPYEKSCTIQARGPLWDVYLSYWDCKGVLYSSKKIAQSVTWEVAEKIAESNWCK